MSKETTSKIDNKQQLTVDEAYKLALDHFTFENYEQADKICTSILQSKPHRIDVINLLGLIAQKINRHDLAVEQFDSGIKIDDKIPLLHYNLGTSLYQLARVDEAIQALTQAIAINPEFCEAHSSLGNAFMLQEKFDKATEHIQKAILINPDYSLAHFNLAAVLQKQNKLDEAVLSYKKAVTISPNNAEFHYNLGIALHLQNRLDEATNCYQKAVAIYPQYSDAHYNIAIIKQDQNRFDEAIKSYHKTIETDPNYFNAFINVGVILQDLHRYEEAANYFQKALIINPQSAKGLNNLGVALQKQGKFLAAMTSLQKAISVDNKDYQTHSNLGVCLEKMEKKEESFVAFRKAVQLYPGFPKQLSSLGDALNKSEISDKLTFKFSDISNSIMGSNKKNNLANLNIAQSSSPNIEGSFYNIDNAIHDFIRKRSDYTQDNNKLKILLLQPPIWKIQEQGQPPYKNSQGGNENENIDDVDNDAKSTTYGLLSIAAQVLQSNRKVLVCNISTYTWENVKKLIRNVDINLVGITCMTFNLRGVKALTNLIRDEHPKAHIVLGGTHPTALPEETLNHFNAVDTVVIGEGELPFLDIVEHLEKRKPVKGIAGTAWRDENKQVQIGPFRQRIENLDKLASPHDYFLQNMLITSRGCPFRCTFCGSETQWGSKLKMNSNDKTIETIDKIVNKNGIKFLAIKDDTFTAVRKRTLNLCQQIVARKINFLWSCDTRINSLDAEVLRAMRMAGCQGISVGVESGSPTILKTIKKKLIPEKVIEVSNIARKYGLQVRFYMIVGNRGENLATFKESLQLIYDAQPNQFLFSPLTLTPGTTEYEINKQEGIITPDTFFNDDYSEYSYGYIDNVEKGDKDIIDLWLNCFGNSKFKYFNVEESIKILDRLDNLHSAHMDLAGAYLRGGQPNKAELHIHKAIENGFPLTEFAYNYLACVAAYNGDIESVGSYLKKASQPTLLPIVEENTKAYKDFLKAENNNIVSELKLSVHNNFPLYLGKKQQPFQPVEINLPRQT
ncbi:MAG: tetratricopeptide repeat protein [Magnetococcales bacterium]|nr:tetratricopeptide repeat protein [Magnetococcales bacterium]